MQKRGDKYRVQYWTAAGKRSETFSLKKDAEAFEKKVERERSLIRAGLDLPKESTLLLDHAGKYLRRRHAQEKQSTVLAEARHIKLFVESLGMKPVRSLTTKDIREFLDATQVEREWSNATRNRCRAYLHIMFQAAFEDEEIMINPVSRIPALPENPAKKVPLTPEEVGKMLKAAGDAERYLFACLLAFQGPRVSEAVGLDHGDFDLRHGFLSFRRIVEQETGELQERIKGSPEGIVVPLMPIVRVAYMNHLTALKKKPSPGDPVFRDQHGRRASTYTGKSWVATLREHSGIKKKLSPHVLRATFASLAEENGMSREVIQKLMGHSTIAVTQRYVSRRDDQIKQTVLDSGFGAVNVVQLKRKKSR